MKPVYAFNLGNTQDNTGTYSIGFDKAVFNVLTELEMTFIARQNGGKARYLKHCKCV